MTENINKIFGKQLRIIRQKKGFTQEALAYEVNLNRTYIGRIERGERNISLAVADKLARTLDTDIRRFFTKKE